MKLPLIFALILLMAASSFAAVRDSTFQRHQFSVSMANGVSQEFFDGPTHRPTNEWSVNNFGGYLSYIYTPMYAMHMQLHYSLGISRMVRIETGIGYLLSSYTITQGFATPGAAFINFIKTYYYQGNITLPLYVKFIKPTQHGAFTCSIGPDFTLPVHSFYHYADVSNFSSPILGFQANGHTRFNASETGQATSMGLYLKMAYEKQINSHLSINIGPVVDFFGLVEFHTGDDRSVAYGYYPYQFYTGLDVAVSFGVKGKR